jgi:hypothetical protein
MLYALLRFICQYLFSDYFQTASARLNSPASARLSFMTNLYPIVNRFFLWF